MAETSEEVIRRYLQDVIAAARSFEVHLEGLSKTSAAHEIFHTHARETRDQHERLTARLSELGGSPSTAKTLLAQLFGSAAAATAGFGHEKENRTTQDLVTAFTIANSELAMYESLATMADAAGDADTAALSRAIQAEGRAAAENIWRALPAAAENAFIATNGNV